MVSFLENPTQLSYYSGINHCAVYSQSTGVFEPWLGVVTIDEVPLETLRAVYLDGLRIRNDCVDLGFAAKISAYTYPEIIEEPEVFDLTYLVSDRFLNVIYGVNFALVTKVYSTVSSNIDPSLFEFETVSVGRTLSNGTRGFRVVIDLDDLSDELKDRIFDTFYGATDSSPEMLSPDELTQMFAEDFLVIIDNGDGTWTATGPPRKVHMLDATTFEIDAPTATYIDSDTYTVSSE